MKCLHGEPVSCSTTKNDSFSFGGQNPSCNFFWSEDAGFLFEKDIAACRATNQPQHQCYVHQKLAKMRVVKDKMNAD